MKNWKFLFLLLLMTSMAHGMEDEWFPFFFPAKLDPASPINIGKLVLDAPAGKHGFVKVKDGRFYFEDGMHAKFWGTNLTFSACFPDKKQAEIVADRLAFFGFNAVRLHHMDSSFEPRGIFEDIFPAFKDPQMKKTGTLSKKQLDRLDYLIYQLKQRGIYVDVNLLVSRHFTEADGVIDAGKLGMAAKPASMFDSRLIGLQKKYAKDLLTHYNPYTKLRYCDDPAIALIEITNENSIFGLDKKPIPDYYLKQLEHTSYMELEKKYFKEMTAFLKKECNVKVPITGIGGYSHLEDIEAQESCDFIDKHAYWDHPRFPHKRWDRNDFRIRNKSMLKDTNLGIIGNILSSEPKAVNKELSKPYTISEWNHCYPNQYAYETPVLFASYAVKNDWDGLFQFSFSGEEPVFDDIQTWFNVMTNSQQLVLSSLGGLLFHKAKDLKINLDNSILRVDSNILKGIAGFIKNKTFEFDNLTITPNQDGAVFVYSPEGKSFEKSNNLIVVAISEIKNTNSGWSSKEKFNWGSAPTLLKNMDVKITKDGKIFTFSTKELNSPWFEISTQNSKPLFQH